MGNTFEVSVYKQQEDGSYKYEEVYRGESKRDAEKEMKHQVKIGIKCVRLEWRP